jgi:cytochrome c550
MHKWTLLILFCAACVLGLAGLILAIPEPSEQEGEAAPGPVVDDIPLNVAAAEEVYQANCISCHGDQLQGGFGPELATVGSRLSPEELADKILNGVGNRMPAFRDQLGQEQISHLVKWLSEQK